MIMTVIKSLEGNKLSSKRVSKTSSVSKQCSKCNISKPITDFNKDKRRQDGLHCQCRQCIHSKDNAIGVSPDMQKSCIKCKIKKPLRYFFRNKRCKYGVDAKCRDCVNQINHNDDLTASNTKKFCASCNENKSITEFHKKSKGRYGVTARCKNCEKSSVKQRHVDYNENGQKCCTTCKVVKSVREFHKHNLGLYGVYSKCKDCLKRKYIDDSKVGMGFLRRLWNDAFTTTKRRNEKGRNMIFTLTLNDVRDKWDAQKGLCAITGMHMVCKPHSHFKTSIERRNNEIGYTNENTVLVISEVNTALQWNSTKALYLFSNMQYSPNDLTDKLKKPGRWWYALKALYNHAKQRSRLKFSKPFTLTFEELVDICRNQGGLCYYSKKPMMPVSGDYKISIERLDVMESYTSSNVVLIAAEFNSADFTRVKTKDSNHGCAGWSLSKYAEVKKVFNEQR